MRGILYFLLFLAIGTVPLTAQETWSLERCIRIGLDNNPGVRLADLSAESAVLEERRWTYAMLPTVNANLSAGYQFGRTIDPTSNTFIEATTNFSNGQVSASLILFDGFRIRHGREQGRLNALAGKASSEDARNIAALQIATAYINVLFAEEQAETVLRQRDLAREQLAQTERLVSAGLRPDMDRLALVSQVAQSDYQLVLQENAVQEAYLILSQLMVLDPTVQFRIERPSFDPGQLADPRVLQTEMIYQHAVENQPSVKAALLLEQSAEKGEDIARAGLIPSLRLFGGLSTAYSNNFLDFGNPDFSNANLVPGIPQPVLLDGEQKLLTLYNLQGVNFPALSFADQVNRNFGKNVGLNLQIPIYNNHASRLAMQQARVSFEQARVNREQVEQQLKATVASALQAAQAARSQYLAAREAVEAQQAAYVALGRRFELGAANPMEYATAKTNLDVAENQAVIAKYTYLFRMKVLDFYLGKPLTLP
jgi:outer membrane protein